MDYLDLLRQTGHQLEDASNFRTQVQKEPNSSKRVKSDDRHTSEKRGTEEGEKGHRPTAAEAPQLSTRVYKTRRNRAYEDAPECASDSD